MGFLKKSSAPSELPDLAMGNPNVNVAPVYTQPVIARPLPVLEPVLPQPVVVPVAAPPIVRKEVAGEDYLEFPSEAGSSHNDIKKVIDEKLESRDIGHLSRAGFFDQVLDDLNGEMKDLGKLEDWYEKKFVKENVVSNMKGYWEGNKADIIIESFGAEYKRQINEKVRVLQDLEEDWREIYFRLIKKEEEMKKEERELKETVSEFVNLCKSRKGNGEEK